MAYRNYSVANGFTVDKLGNGDFKTITAALTAATSGTTIFIRPGTYTENLILKAGVNLTSFQTDSYNGTVTISGNTTLNVAGTANISGIRLQTNMSNAITVGPSGSASILNLFNCDLNFTNFTGISFTSTNANSVINFINCFGDLGIPAIAYYSSTSVGNIRFLYCFLTNTGNSTAASSNSAGAVLFNNSISNFAFGTTGTGQVVVQFSVIDNTNINTACLTTAGTGVANSISECILLSGTAPCVSIGVNTLVNISNSKIGSSNATSVIAGAGSVTYAGNFYSGSQVNINTTTQVGGTLQGGTNGNAPSPGFLGEQFASFINSAGKITLMNVTPANITSINLTPGIWDVSCVAQFNSDGGAVTGTSIIASISTTSATLGTPGDNYVNNVTMPNADSDQGLTIPSFRVTISSTMGTTPVYLVVQGNFTMGTLKAYGRISATRVG